MYSSDFLVVLSSTSWCKIPCLSGLWLPTRSEHLHPIVIDENFDFEGRLGEGEVGIHPAQIEVAGADQMVHHVFHGLLEVPGHYLQNLLLLEVGGHVDVLSVYPHRRRRSVH